MLNVAIFLKAMENGTESVCVFWDEELDEGYGGWSTEGCALISDSELAAICECDHLTSFALLVVGSLAVCMSETHHSCLILSPIRTRYHVNNRRQRTEG